MPKLSSQQISHFAEKNQVLFNGLIKAAQELATQWLDQDLICSFAIIYSAGILEAKNKKMNELYNQSQFKRFALCFIDELKQIAEKEQLGLDCTSLFDLFKRSFDEDLSNNKIFFNPNLFIGNLNQIIHKDIPDLTMKNTLIKPVNAYSYSELNMAILGGFTIALGATAVATALLVLTLPLYPILAPACLGFGITAIIAGACFFSRGLQLDSRYGQTSEDDLRPLLSS